jgi:hypothetical protein
MDRDTQWTLPPFEDEPGYLLGTVLIEGTEHHVEAIQVTKHPEHNSHEPTHPTDNNQSRLNDLDQTTGSYKPYCVTTIPNHPGDWVIIVTPYST